MSRRSLVLLVVAVAVAVGLGVLIGAAVFGGDDDEPSTTGSSTTSTTSPAVTAPTTAAVEGLTGDALALAEAINRAAGLTYHATFRGLVPSNTPGQPGGELVVEVWRRPPEARRDSTIKSGGQELYARELRLADQVLGCARLTPDQPLRCAPNPSPEADPSAPLFGSVDPKAGSVSARDANVAGVAARCFTVTPAAGGAAVQEACFDADGVPVVIDGGDGRLERTAVDRAVDDSVFIPPP